MAHSILPLFTVVAVVIGYSIGLGSALRLDVSPESINTMITDQLDLTCISNGPAWIRSIETLGIMKKGDHPIAVISSKGLAKGAKWTDNVEAQGNLTKDSINNFLKLTIKNPGEEDTGTYVCQMFYLDENNKLHEMKAEVNVTVENENITVIVKYLLDKITTLEKNGQELKEKEKSMQEEVTKLKETISTQKVKLAEQDTTLMEQEKKLKEQKKENNKVSSRIDFLEDMEKNQNQSMKESMDKVSSRIAMLEDLEKKQNQSIKYSMDKVIEDIGQLQIQSSRFQKYLDLSPVAFSYSYDKNGNTKISEGQTLLFTERIMDLGGNFNPSTGSFTAPIKGIYVFHLVITTSDSDDGIQVDLRVGKQRIATLYSLDKEYWDQSSVSTAVLLDRGKGVRPVVRQTNRDDIRPDDHFSYFTGYLLKPISIQSSLVSVF